MAGCKITATIITFSAVLCSAEFVVGNNLFNLNWNGGLHLASPMSKPPHAGLQETSGGQRLSRLSHEMRPLQESILTHRLPYFDTLNQRFGSSKERENHHNFVSRKRRSVHHIDQTYNEKNSKETRQILDLLEQGEAEVEFDADTHKNTKVVLVLGNTGAGKSTFSHWLTGNDEDLMAREIGETGEFTITDVTGKINGNSTISSFTIFPKRVVDSKTGTVFYDCPGFIDTRNLAHDIASTYFTKKVIDTASKVKLIFVVNHSSLKVGENRHDFMLLVKHATKMMKDVNKFRESIALVATKVDNSYKKGLLVSDEKVIAGIAGFLRAVRSETAMKILESSLVPDVKQFYEKSVEFIDVLLEQKDNHYTRLGIFRRPDEAGQLKNISLLESGKKSLEKILHTYTQYTKHDEKDFGYTLSSDSQNLVHGVIENILDNVDSNVFEISKEIERHFSTQEKQLEDIQILHDKFKSAHSTFLATKKKTKTLQDFVELVTENIHDLGIGVSTKNLLRIANYELYTKFLLHVSGQQTPRQLEWIQGFVSLIEYLNSSQHWYRFLLKLFSGLSEYPIQRDVSRYRILSSNLTTQIMDLGNHDRVVQSLKDFLDLVMPNEADMEYDKIDTVKLNEVRLSKFKLIADLGLNSGMIATREKDNRLVIKGQFIKFSDVPKLLDDSVELVEIFALEKLFIDVDLDLTGKTQLALIAPTWDVRGSRKITLNGVAGEAITPGKANDGFLAATRWVGTDGEDGKPGKPGGPAGRCLGIGRTFINGHELTVSLVGGQGGPGQKGGDGVNGTNGTKPDISHLKGDDYSWFADLDSYNCDRGEKFLEWLGNDHDCSFDGKYCSNGSGGGNGGRGGDGGRAGMGVLVSLNSNDPFISLQKFAGPIGEGGEGGRGGQAGVPGQRKKFKAIYHLFENHFHFEEGPWEFLPSCFPGKDGLDGNIAKLVTGTTQDKVQLIHPHETINRFRYFLRENLVDSVRGSHLSRFLDEIENHEEFLSLYDLQGFLNELYDLERQFQSMKMKIPFVPFYNSLLDRIELYAQKSEKSDPSKQSKKVLAYLYTAILSKICFIGNSMAEDLVVDIKVYLDSVKNNIEALKESSKVVLSNTYVEMHTQPLKKKIHEAQNFLDTQIRDELNNLSKDIDHEIQTLVDQTISLQAAGEEEKANLVKLEKKLGNSLILKKTLGIIKIVSTFLNFAGILGGNVGEIVEGAALISKSLSLNDNSLDNAGKENIPLISADNSSTSVNLNQRPDERLYEPHQKLNEVLKENILDPIEKMSAIMSKAQDYLQQATDNGTTSGSNADRATHPLLDLFSGLLIDKNKINKVKDAIHHVETKLEALAKYEQNIYKILIPAVQNMKVGVMATSKQLNGASRAFLVINKWQMQTTIKNAKIRITEMSRKFDLHESLFQLLEKLEEGMTLMVEVYDRMEYYRDNAELAAYISDINSASGTRIQVDDIELKKSIDELQLNIKSNLVLQNYETALNAFKQYKFPFASFYLSTFALPPSLQMNDTRSLAIQTINNVQNLQNILLHSSSTVNKPQDKYIYSNVLFSSNSGRLAPFFVWKHASIEKAIPLFLEGKEVTLKADIKHGVLQNAVKFNDIGIRFILPNQNAQEELDKLLQDFEVKMTHSGNSYYRCNDKVYVIRSEKLAIGYSFSGYKNGDPELKNDVYRKLKSHDPFLSPYAMWSFKLTQRNGSDFGVLKKFKSEAMDIELEGRGQFVEFGADVCSGDLEKDYEIDSALS